MSAVDTFAPGCFDGTVVLVTGGAHGIGRAYGEGFAALGARVVLADVDGEGAAATATAIGPSALGVAMDVTDDAQIEAGVARAVEAFGGVDVLINDAGLHMGRFNECGTLPREEWAALFDVNVFGAVACARAVRPTMAARGGGVIVNQSSTAARTAGGGAYGASKLALDHCTMALAAELAPDGVRVVGIAPGMVGSPAVLERLEDRWKDMVVDAQLVKRFGEMDDCVGLVLWLCSDAAGFVTGHTFTTDGGFGPRT